MYRTLFELEENVMNFILHRGSNYSQYQNGFSTQVLFRHLFFPLKGKLLQKYNLFGTVDTHGLSKQ